MSVQQGYIGNLSIFDLVNQFDTPLYVYDKKVIEKNFLSIVRSIPYQPFDPHFAMLSNANPHILRVIRGLGSKIHVCSPGELLVALRTGILPENIIVTGSNFKQNELKLFIDNNITINLDSLLQLELYGKLNPGGEVGIRINLDVSLPKNESVYQIYAGSDARLGIPEKYIEEAKRIVQQYQLRIIGIHNYVGTNIQDTNIFLFYIEHLIRLGIRFDTLEYINIGGGFGINYEDPSDGFKWEYFGNEISKKMEWISAELGNRITLKMEPGRSIIASAGVLLSRVTDVKINGDNVFIGTDTSMSNFARSYIYDAYHRVLVFREYPQERYFEKASVCGNTVASGDFLARNRRLLQVNVGDIIAILDVGAYGYTMSSHFCGRLKPAEILVNGDEVKLIRQREDFNVLLYGTEL